LFYRDVPVFIYNLWETLQHYTGCFHLGAPAEQCDVESDMRVSAPVQNNKFLHSECFYC